MDKIGSAEFIKELDEKLKRYADLRGDQYKESLREQNALTKCLYKFLLKPDGLPDSRLYDSIVESVDSDINGWIVGLPFALSDKAGMVDEAVEICHLFAEIHSPDNFLGDLAVILAEAERREEAFDRISKNLERFPDDAWVIIKAGSAYQALRETDKAIELYNRAYGMTRPLSYDREGVLERLAPLLRELGRNAEADALEESEEKARKERYSRFENAKKNYSLDVEKPQSAPVGSKKIGRNEPCPCGSGKKYKKCCGQ